MLIQINLVLFFTFFAILLNKDMLQRVNKTLYMWAKWLEAKGIGAKRPGREKTWDAKRPGRKTTRNHYRHVFV